jgi:hypothetical protein
MRFIAAVLIVVFVVGGAPVGAGPAPSPASADPAITAAADRATEAAARLAVLAEAIAPAGKVPRQSDPTVAGLLAAVLNTDLLKTRKPSLADLAAVTAWGNAIVSVTNIYAASAQELARLGRGEKAAPSDTRSYIALAPELGRLLDASFVLQNAAVRIVVTDKSVTEADLFYARLAMVTVIAGNLEMISPDGLDPAWRLARLQALQAEVQLASAVLLAADCKTVRDTAASTARKVGDPTLTARLKIYSDALKC